MLIILISFPACPIGLTFSYVYFPGLDIISIFDVR